MRERYIAAVQARLDRVAAAQDAAAALAPGVLDDIRRLTDEVGDEDDVEAGFALGWLHWYRYLSLPEGQDREDLRAAIHALVGCFVYGVEPLPEPLLPVLAVAAVPSATAMLRHAMAAPGPEPILGAVELWERIVTRMDEDEPEWPGYVSNLGVALQILFERTRSAEYIDAAVEVLRHAVEAGPAGGVEPAARLHRLGRALLARFELSGSEQDLDDAIESARRSAEDGPADAMHHWLLGAALRQRYDRTRSMPDLDEAIAADRRAVGAAEPGSRDQAGFRSNLAGALNARFEATGASADLDAALDVYGEAGDLYNLAVLRTTRFRRDGVVADLDTAIDAYRRVLETAGAAERPRTLSNLGVALRSRFELTGSLADIDDAITAGQAALAETPPSDPGRGTPLTNLGVSLLARYRQRGVREDLDTAITTGREALAATPPDRLERAAVCNNLGLALLRRFEADGEGADLEDAVQIATEAVTATPTGSPDRPARMINLMLALRLRFEYGRSMADLDAAIGIGQEAIDALPAGHPGRAAFLADLGTTWHVRYRRAGSSRDLDGAVDAFQEAADALSPGQPLRAGTLHNLGIALRDRFTRSGAPADLDAAIAAGREAVDATRAGAPARAGLLSTLGEAYRDRFERTGTPADLDAALDAVREAVRATPPGSPDRATHLAHLGNVLKHRAELVEDALAAYRGALADPAGSPDVRISAAQAAATLVRTAQPEVAADLLEAACSLLPQVTARPREWDDREQELSRFEFLVADAAALALSTPEPAPLRALRLLDSGRATLLSRMMETRAQPVPEPADLRSAAEQGPIVVCNISRYRSDALLLTSDGIGHIPLPGLDAAIVLPRFQDFLQALLDATLPDTGWRERARAQDAINETLEWLWDAVAEPVLHALGFDEPPAPGTPLPRIWWAPGGMLGQLPLQAAGYHRSADGRTLLDRAVSSYTPTVRALRRSRSGGDAGTADAGALVVAMPTTPGAEPLPNAEAEAELLRALLPEALVLVEPGRDEVLAALSGRAIAHFACHGVSDAFDPSRSGLLLHDHETAALTVAALAAADLAAADLAYLSACATANMNVVTLGTVELAPETRDALPDLAASITRINRNTRLVDEAIHLTSAFQLAGFRHVVGTLWEISDAVSVEVTDAFYTALRTESGDLATGRSAEALHDAVRALRDRLPRTPSLWAAYLHAGA